MRCSDIPPFCHRDRVPSLQAALKHFPYADRRDSMMCVCFLDRSHARNSVWPRNVQERHWERSLHQLPRQHVQFGARRASLIHMLSMRRDTGVPTGQPCRYQLPPGPWIYRTWWNRPCCRLPDQCVQGQRRHRPMHTVWRQPSQCFSGHSSYAVQGECWVQWSRWDYTHRRLPSRHV